MLFTGNTPWQSVKLRALVLGPIRRWLKGGRQDGWYQAARFLPRSVPIKIETEAPGHVGHGDLPPYAVAVHVKRRRERGDAKSSRSDRHDATTDPALARQTDLEGPVAGGIVEPFHHHLGENPWHILPFHY